MVLAADPLLAAVSPRPARGAARGSAPPLVSGPNWAAPLAAQLDQWANQAADAGAGIAPGAAMCRALLALRAARSGRGSGLAENRGANRSGRLSGSTTACSGYPQVNHQGAACSAGGAGSRGNLSGNLGGRNATSAGGGGSAAGTREWGGDAREVNKGGGEGGVEGVEGGYQAAVVLFLCGGEPLAATLEGVGPPPDNCTLQWLREETNVHLTR